MATFVHEKDNISTSVNSITNKNTDKNVEFEYFFADVLIIFVLATIISFFAATEFVTSSILSSFLIAYLSVVNVALVIFLVKRVYRSLTASHRQK